MLGLNRLHLSLMVKPANSRGRGLRLSPGAEPPMEDTNKLICPLSSGFAFMNDHDPKFDKFLNFRCNLAVDNSSRTKNQFSG